MNIRKHVIRAQSGFTLIEVMIALVILAAGLLALSTMQIVSIRSNAFSSEMTYSTMLAQQRIEILRNLDYSDPENPTFTRFGTYGNINSAYGTRVIKVSLRLTF